MQLRTEYPRPQLRRDSYLCLNGEWDFAIDTGISLEERGLFLKDNYDRKIQVPFCPEAKLSGIEYTDFMNAVSYQRLVYIGFREEKILKINFGASDYETKVYVNQKFVGLHKGGYTSFSFEIQDYIEEEADNLITVYVKDDSRSEAQPRGKQCPTYLSKVCDYTRTTGIWQTVWMEWVKPVFIQSLRLIPDVAGETLFVEAPLNTWFTGEVKAEVRLDGKDIITVEQNTAGRSIQMAIPIANPQCWGISNPVLYDLKISLKSKEGKEDEVESYFGMREISFDGKTFTLNGKKIFLRMVLDQGYYPDGIYTAPSEEALANDILLSQKAGFNGARLHQKVFEERFLYHCDLKGYLVFAEYPDAGLSKDKEENFLAIAREWNEAMVRDYSHPAIIGWCPLNETSINRNKDFLRGMYEITKTIDPGRPVIDASGFTHVVTDIYDVHDYEQDIDAFKKHMEFAGTDKTWVNFPEQEKYDGQPYFVSEYGGIWWADQQDGESWGYGNRPGKIEDFYKRYKGLTDALLENKSICGFCYTQLTDVEQEKNGIYSYDRSEKFDIERISNINKGKAKAESLLT